MRREEKLEELLSWLNLCNDIKEVIDFYMDDDENLEAMPEDSFEELLECWDVAEDMVLRWLDELNTDDASEEDFVDLDDSGEEGEWEWEWSLPKHDQTDFDEDFTPSERVLINRFIASMKRKNVLEAALDLAFGKAGL